MNPIELGIVSDEITPDFREAVRHALGWGIRKFELRVLQTGRVPRVDPAEIAAVEEVLRSGQVQITALSPGIFKHELSKEAELEAEVQDALPSTIALARRLGAPMIILFGFHREEGESPARYRDAVRWMQRAASIAEKSGIRLAVENEPGFWADTGVNTRKLVQDVGSRFLGANWDPCNAFGTAERPFPEGYAAVRDVIVNVHIKDTAEGSLIRCVPVGDGAIDWKGQMHALMQDGIVRHATIETHCLPLVENSRHNVETLRKYMQEMA